MNSNEQVKIVYEALEDKKADDITIIDIRHVSVIADYFIIAGAKNNNQLEALKDNVDEKMYKAGMIECHIEGNKSSTWILMDYSDVIVHLFSQEDRLFYNLERIWQDGKTVDISEI